MEDRLAGQVENSHYGLVSEETQSVQGYIAIKGTRNGLLLTLEPETPFGELLNALAERLAEVGLLPWSVIISGYQSQGLAYERAHPARGTAGPLSDVDGPVLFDDDSAVIPPIRHYAGSGRGGAMARQRRFPGGTHNRSDYQ